MLYAAILMNSDEEFVVSDPAWQHPADVCRAFNIQGPVQVGRVHLFWHGPYAGQSLRIVRHQAATELVEAQEAWSHARPDSRKNDDAFVYDI